MISKRNVGLSGLVALLSGVVVMACSAGPGPDTAVTAVQPQEQSKILLSETYTVDRKYRSMKGPQSQQQILFSGDGEDPELLWITGYEAVMVGADGASPMAQEFMCHSNLDVNSGAHRQALGARGLTPNSPNSRANESARLIDTERERWNPSGRVILPVFAAVARVMLRSPPSNCVYSTIIGTSVGIAMLGPSHSPAKASGSYV